MVKPGAWLARPPPGAQQTIPPLFYLRGCKSCTHGRPSLTVTQSGQCPGRLEARSEAGSAFLPLKPEQDYFNFISLTVTWEALHNDTGIKKSRRRDNSKCVCT